MTWVTTSESRQQPPVREDHGVSDLERVRCPRCRSAESDAVLCGHDYLHQLPGEFFVAECRGWPLVSESETPDRDAGLALSGRLPPACLVRPRFWRDAVAASVHVSVLREHLDTRLFRWHPLIVGSIGARCGGSIRCGGGRPASIARGSSLTARCGHRLRERQPPASLRAYGWRRLNGIELVAAAAAEARRTVSRSGAVRSVDARITPGRISRRHRFQHGAGAPAGSVRGRPAIAAKLKPGGQFLFSTVVHDSLDARIYGKFWAVSIPVTRSLSPRRSRRDAGGTVRPGRVLLPIGPD
jgi:hypothetical protein